MAARTRWISSGEPDTTDEWVDAGPFRAHLRQLMVASALGSDEIAVAAGVPPRVTEHLAYGRQGRPLRRISPDVARRLYRLTVDELAFLERLRVPSDRARRQLRRLRRAGWTDAVIARRVGSTTSELRLLAHRGPDCSELLTVRLTAAAKAVESARWQERLRSLDRPAVELAAA